jgi:two-component system response regulator MprA
MRSPKVLVVEDEKDILEPLVDRLVFYGLDVRTARDGIECLERVAEEVPDLVILDLLMPRMDGLTALGRLHASHPDLPVIIYTGSSGRSVAEGALMQGALGYVLKPDTEALQKMVFTVLEKREHE